VAFRVRCVLRPEDLVARLGGDEFSVLCSVSSREEALVIPGRLLEAMSSPFSLDAHSIRASFSARVAVSASPSADSAELLRQADSAMYRPSIPAPPGWPSSGTRNAGRS
jgi:diguanylate cyclase (GGDEF)-like protein